MSDWLELSDMQRSILVHEAVAGRPIYNMPVCFHLSGPIDHEAFAGALQAVLLGHPVLSSFYETNRARRAGEAEVRAVEFRREAIEGSVPAGISALASWWEQPFNLRAELPVRFRLISLSHDEHLFGICMHHVAGDDWSIAIFLRDFSAAYRSYLSVGAAAVEGADFFAYAAREAAGEWDAGWWVERLSGARVSTSHRVLADLGESQLLDLGVEAYTRHVRTAARRVGVSAVSVLLAAVALTSRSGPDVTDSLIGVPCAMRETEELQRTAGPLLTTLPVRTLWDQRAGPADIVRAHSASLLASLSNGAVPYSRIVGAVRAAGLLFGAPLFTHVLNVDAGRPRLHLSGLKCAPIEVQPRWSTFPVVWDFVIPTVGSIKGLLRVSTKLYAPARGLEWVRAFQLELERIDKTP